MSQEMLDEIKKALDEGSEYAVAILVNENTTEETDSVLFMNQKFVSSPEQLGRVAAWMFLAAHGPSHESCLVKYLSGLMDQFKKGGIKGEFGLVPGGNDTKH